MEKTCKTCNLARENKGGCPPAGSDGCTGSNLSDNHHSWWQPIPEKPKEPKQGEFRVRKSKAGGNWVIANGPEQAETNRYIDESGKIDKNWDIFETETKPEAEQALAKYLDSLKPEEKTCKDCKNYEVYDGAAMWCNTPASKFHGPRSHLAICACFSAVKPAKSQADYEAHVNLLNSRLQDQKEQYKAKAKEASGMRRVDGCYNCFFDADDLFCDNGLTKRRSNCFKAKVTPKPLKSKENKMLKKFRSRARRIAMAWDLFGLGLIGYFVNPWLCKFWQFVLPYEFFGKKETREGVIAISIQCWIFTVVSIATLIATLYGFDRLTAWWYGEK